MASASRDFWFCAAHRLRMLRGPEYYLHGHTFRARVTVALTLGGDPPLPLRQVFDLSLLGPLREWIEENLDRSVLLDQEDEAGKASLRAWEEVACACGRVYFTEGQPTTECLARIILDRAQKLTDWGRGGRVAACHVSSVQVWDTPWTSATVVG